MRRECKRDGREKKEEICIEDGIERIELIGIEEEDKRMMIEGGMKILEDSNEIKIRREKIVNKMKYLVKILEKEKNNEGIGENGRIKLIKKMKKEDGVEIERKRKKIEIFRRKCLEIVVEKVRERIEKDIKRELIEKEVRCKNIDSGRR